MSFIIVAPRSCEAEALTLTVVKCSLQSLVRRSSSKKMPRQLTAFLSWLFWLKKRVERAPNMTWTTANFEWSAWSHSLMWCGDVNLGREMCANRSSCHWAPCLQCRERCHDFEAEWDMNRVGRSGIQNFELWGLSSERWALGQTFNSGFWTQYLEF